MAYYTVYGKYPEERLRGRTLNPKKMWRGYDVDANLKDEWLERLNELPVEIQSTDEGKDETRVAFVIFRMLEENENLSTRMVEELSKEEHVNVHADTGFEGRQRICVAHPLWKGKVGWENWWETLPEKIHRAYQRL